MSRIHALEVCEPPCPFHAPSLHHMERWEMSLRESGLVERVCRHEVGHPDPDSLAFWDRHGRDFGVHGCDGCCQVAALPALEVEA